MTDNKVVESAGNKEVKKQTHEDITMKIQNKESVPISTSNVENKEENEESGGMEAVHRIAKLPVVDATLQTATNLYEKVKDLNSVTNWTLTTAEDTVHKAVAAGKPLTDPVMEKLEGPMKKMDDLLCTGLDYVEDKCPAVKLPPGEIYHQTRDYVVQHVEPLVNTAITTAQSCKHVIDPAIDKAKEVLHLNQPSSNGAGSGCTECSECKRNREEREGQPKN